MSVLCCVVLSRVACQARTWRPMDLSRVQKEIKEISLDKASGISVRVMGNDLTRLQGTINGPKDTVYEGGE